MTAREIDDLLEEETERTGFGEARATELQAEHDALLLAYLTEIARAARLQRDLDIANAGWLGLSDAVWVETRNCAEAA